MKVAVVHDYFVTFAGAERVTREILAMFPAADVFCLLDSMVEDREFLAGHRITESPLGNFPAVHRYYRNLFPLFPWAVEALDVREYDLIISSSHAVAKGVRTYPNQVHICYCHSPPRWAWDQKSQYLEESGLTRGPKAALVRFFLNRFQAWDARTHQGVTHFIANSRFVRGRIRRFYGREASVAYPPVDTASFALCEEKDDYFLVVSRLVWYKKIRVAVEAFNAMPNRRLIVAGGGPQFREIRALAGPNVEVRGYVPHPELRSLMRHAKALVFPAEEDFGIAPVEAQCCGTPVIAFHGGGALETVVDGKTGLFFRRQDAASVRAAVRRFEAKVWNAGAISAQGNRFSRLRFRRTFLSTARSVLRASGIDELDALADVG